MNKPEFLSALRERLSCLPKEDIRRTIDYYSEMIDDRMEDGMSEAQAIEAVGTIEEIVSKTLMDTSLPQLVRAKVKRPLRIWEIVLLILGSPVWLPLLAAVVVIILSVYIVLWAAVVVLYAGDISFAAGGVAGTVGSFASLLNGNYEQAALFCGAALICVGIMILLFYGSKQVTKGVVYIGKMILLGIKRCFIRKGEAQ